jgi:hypothetical protein
VRRFGYSHGDYYTLGASFLFDKLVLIQVIGYTAMTRSFGYVGVPSLRLFLGEMVLGLFMLRHPRAILGCLGRWMFYASPLSGLSIAMLAFLLYGIAEVIHGLACDYNLLVALQCLVFNYYPLYIFLGIWVAQRKPQLLRNLVLIGAWIHGLYGVAYLIILSEIYVQMPGAAGVGDGVGIFGQPEGSAIFLLGLICFPAKPALGLPAMVLNAIVLAGVQVRAEWLGFLVALTIWGFVTGRIINILKGYAIIAILMVIGLATDIHLPGAAGRGGDVSSRLIIGRIMAPVYPELAAEYTPGADVFAGTMKWRTEWWHAIWQEVHMDDATALFGFGYGFPLGNLVPYLRDQVIRSPHNVFFYILGYSGWLGVLIFAWFHAQLALTLWKALRFSGQPFGLTLWVYGLTGAFFEPFFETPFGAIPLYLCFGLAAGCLVSDEAALPTQKPVIDYEPAPTPLFVPHVAHPHNPF